MPVRSPVHRNRSSPRGPLRSTKALTYTARCSSLHLLSSMPDDTAARMTTLIAELRRGNPAAKEELITRIYPELRRIAAHYMRQERPNHTLKTTGLVNEMYLRLFGQTEVDWQ